MENKILKMSHEDQVAQAAQIWLSRASELKEAEAAEKDAKDFLIKTCGGDFEGSGVRVEVVERKGSVDYTKIPALQMIDVDLYRKPATIYWSVRASVKQ